MRIKHLIFIILPLLSCGCSSTSSRSEHAKEANSSLDSIIANEVKVVRYSDVSFSSDGLIVDRRGEPLTCRVYSNVISDSVSIMYEDIADGNVIGLKLYHPNGQLAYKTDSVLNYNGEFYSPEGDLIDFDTFADKYWRIWHEHEFEVPITLVCPACLNDIIDYEKWGDNYNPDDIAVFRLENKKKRGPVKIIKQKP